MSFCGVNVVSPIQNKEFVNPFKALSKHSVANVN